MQYRKILVKTFITGIFKSCAAFMTLFITIMLTRNLDVDESGLFLLGLSIITALAVFFRLGLDNVVLKILSSSEGDLRNDSLTTGLIWIVLFSVSSSALLIILSDFIANNIFNKPQFAKTLSVLVTCLPAIASYTLISCGFQSKRKVITTVFFQNLGVLLVFFILFNLYSGFIGKLDALATSYLYVFSSYFILILAVIKWNSLVNASWGTIKLKNKKLWESSSNLWAATSMALLVQWSGIIISGIFVEPKDIALFMAAFRLASTISFILLIVNMVIAPEYAKLWSNGSLKEMKKLANLSSRCMILLAFPILLLFCIFPSQILSIFGTDYTDATTLLVILSIGQFINVATGSVGFLLNMSGHEKEFRQVTFLVGPLTMGLSFVLTFYFGVIGAALSTAIGLSLQNLCAFYMVKVKLGFWPVG